MKSLLINGLTCQRARLWAQLHWYESLIPPQKAINLLVILTILIANRVCCDMPKHLNLMTFKILHRPWKHPCYSELLVLVTLRQLEIATKFWENNRIARGASICFPKFIQLYRLILSGKNLLELMEDFPLEVAGSFWPRSSLPVLIEEGL